MAGGGDRLAVGDVGARHIPLSQTMTAGRRPGQMSSRTHQ